MTSMPLKPLVTDWLLDDTSLRASNHDADFDSFLSNVGCVNGVTASGELLAALRDSVAASIGGQRKVAVAYSGGLDSSLIARLASEVAQIVCYACAVAGSHDAVHAPRLAAEDGVDVTMIEIEGEELGLKVASAGALLDSRDPLRIGYTLPVMAVLERCEEEVVLTGSGADELLGGYAKYASAADPRAMMRYDLDKMLAEDRMLKRVAAALGKRLESPFASERVMAVCARLPLDQKVSGSRRKIVLRTVAQELGLPSQGRRKRAAQYSSGIMREMKRQAKIAGTSLSDWVSFQRRA